MAVVEVWVGGFGIDGGVESLFRYHNLSWVGIHGFFLIHVSECYTDVNTCINVMREPLF